MVSVEAAGRRAVRAVDGRVETGVGGDGLGARVEDLGDGGGEGARRLGRSVCCPSADFRLKLAQLSI